MRGGIGVCGAKRFYTVSVSLFKYTNAATLAEAIAQETLANRRTDAQADREGP